MSIHFNEILRQNSANGYQLNTAKSTPEIHIDNDIIKIGAHQLRQLNGLCDDITTPLIIDADASTVERSNCQQNTESMTCRQALNRINKERDLIATANRQTQSRYDAWLNYDNAQSKLSQLQAKLESQKTVCLNAYAQKDQVLIGLQHEINSCKNQINSYESQQQKAVQEYNPPLMNAIDVFVNAYHKYKLDSAAYLREKKTYDQDLVTYQVWHSEPEKEKRNRILNATLSRIEIINAELSEINHQINVKSSSHASATARARGVYGLKTRRVALENEINELKKSIVFQAPQRPLEPQAPIIPPLPDGAIGQFGQCSIEALIRAFEKMKSDHSANLSILGKQISSLKTSITLKKRLIADLNNINPITTHDLYQSSFALSPQLNYEALAKEILQQFSKYLQLNTRMNDCRSVSRPAFPRPDSWPVKPTLSPLPEETLVFQKLILSFDKEACRNEARRKHIPWSFVNKKGYSSRIFKASCLLALGGSLCTYAWRQLWLWAIFTLYNPATWVLAIDIAMTAVAIGGVYLFARQIYAASAQSTYEFIYDSIKSLGKSQDTQQSTFTAYTGWFGLQIAARWYSSFIPNQASRSDTAPLQSADAQPPQQRQELSNRGPWPAVAHRTALEPI